MRRICILDTETSGLDPKKDVVIEVGLIVFDLQHLAPIHVFSSLVFANGNEAEKHNGIPAALLQDAPPAELVWNQVAKAIKFSDVVVAHRVEFDYEFTPEDVRSLRPWVCSKFDLEWPRQKAFGEHLLHLALAHDVAVCNAHRALSDCDTLARLFKRAAELGTDLQAMLQKGMRPKKLYYSMAPFEQKDIVKEHGFAWNPEKHGKNWYRVMAPEDVADLPFRVREIG